MSKKEIYSKKKLGKKIIALRKAYKFTQAALAEKSELEVERIKEIENGAVKKSEIKKLSKAFELPVNCLKILAIKSKDRSNISKFCTSLQKLIYACVEARIAIRKEKTAK